MISRLSSNQKENELVQKYQAAKSAELRARLLRIEAEKNLVTAKLIFTCEEFKSE